MLRYGVFSSRWPLGDQNLWTIVNRNEYQLDGDQMDVPAPQASRYFDIYHGVELKPQSRGFGRWVLSFTLEAKGTELFLRRTVNLTFSYRIS